MHSRTLLMLLPFVDALHVMLSRVQGREIARRWAPEYRFVNPMETKEETVDAISEYLRVYSDLEGSEDSDKRAVLQHSDKCGLVLYIMALSDGSWEIVEHIPSAASTPQARTDAVTWMCARSPRV